MTSNFYIELNLQNEKHFVGCFSIKSLPPWPSKLPASFVIYHNSHWVAILLINKKICLYFDSFGKKISNISLMNYLKPYYQRIFFNNFQLQHDESSKCGQFCITFIKLVQSQTEFKNYILLFDRKSLLKNDEIVNNLMLKCK